MLHMLSCRSLPHRLLGPRGYRLGSVGDDMEAEGEGLFKFVTDSVSVVVANDPPMKTKLPRQLLKIVDGRMFFHVLTSKFSVQRNAFVSLPSVRSRCASCHVSHDHRARARDCS